MSPHHAPSPPPPPHQRTTAATATNTATTTVVATDGSEESQTAQLHWVPNLGVVKQQSFDNTNLELASEP